MKYQCKPTLHREEENTKVVYHLDPKSLQNALQNHSLDGYYNQVVFFFATSCGKFGLKLIPCEVVNTFVGSK